MAKGKARMARPCTGRRVSSLVPWGGSEKPETVCSLTRCCNQKRERGVGKEKEQEMEKEREKAREQAREKARERAREEKERERAREKKERGLRKKVKRRVREEKVRKTDRRRAQLESAPASESVSESVSSIT